MKYGIESLDSSSDNEEVSLRDALNSAFDDIGSGSGEAPAEPAPKAEKPRDEQGKFAKNDYSSKDSGKPATEQPAANSPQEPQNPQAQAPTSLKPEFRAKFAELPPDWRQEIMRREQESHKALTTNDEVRNFGKTLQRELSPYVAQIQAEGGNLIDAVKNTMQTAYNLRFSPPAHKVEMMVGLMNQFGIDPNHVFARLNNGAPRVDPYTQQLEQRLAQIEQGYNAQQYAYQQQQDAQLHGTIESFSSSGKAPYFNDVRNEMIALLEHGRADTLEKAYDMAVWARPDLRALMLQEQDKQRLQEQSAKAQRSRAAASSVTGTPAGASPRAGNSGSLRDSLSEAFDEAYSRN